MNVQEESFPHKLHCSCIFPSIFLYYVWTKFHLELFYHSIGSLGFPCMKSYGFVLMFCLCGFHVIADFKYTYRRLVIIHLDVSFKQLFSPCPSSHVTVSTLCFILRGGVTLLAHFGPLTLSQSLPIPLFHLPDCRAERAMRLRISFERSIDFV